MFSIFDRKALARSRALYLGAASLLVQQILVAFSTYVIVRITQNVEAEQPIVVLLFIFAACILLPYGLAVLGNAAASRLKFAVTRAFAENFKQAFYARPFLWRNAELKRTSSAILVKEGPGLIADSVDTSYYTLSLALNLTLQTIALAYSIEVRLALVLLGGFALALPLTLINRKRISRAAEAMENASYSLTKQISNLWDNVVLGNSYNGQRWEQTFTDRFKLSRAKALSSILITGGASIAVALAFILPLSWYIYSNLTSGALSKAGQLALVAVLPRLLMMLNAAYELLATLNRVVSLKGRAKMLKVELEKSLNEAGLKAPHIQFQALRFADRSGGALRVGSVNDIDLKPGRITVSGPNGSGKSTFILTLKQHLGEKAFLLPCRHDLDFAAASTELSTGQAQAQVLSEIATHGKTEVLLLDEWDANLDAANRAKLDVLIEDLTKRILVVEIRHSASAAKE